MRAVGRADTPPELKLRRLLWRRGVRYRLRKTIGGTRPDIAIMREKIAIFVDGCFWHGCPKHYKAPRRNAHFWRAKVTRNRVKDLAHTFALRALGWRVVRLWECQLRGTTNPVDRVVALRDARRESYGKDRDNVRHVTPLKSRDTW